MKRQPLRRARCGVRLADPNARLYSRFTRNYYCTTIDACTMRAAKLARKLRVAA